MPTEAEIYRDVALAAIKSSWSWRVAWLLFATMVLLLLGFSFYYDQLKLTMLRDIEARQSAADRWNRFLTGAQHADALKECTRHHGTPLWDDYPALPPAAQR